MYLEKKKKNVLGVIKYTYFKAAQYFEAYLKVEHSHNEYIKILTGRKKKSWFWVINGKPIYSLYAKPIYSPKFELGQKDNWEKNYNHYIFLY